MKPRAWSSVSVLSGAPILVADRLSVGVSTSGHPSPPAGTRAIRGPTDHASARVSDRDRQRQREVSGRVGPPVFESEPCRLQLVGDPGAGELRRDLGPQLLAGV